MTLLGLLELLQGCVPGRRDSDALHPLLGLPQLGHTPVLLEILLQVWIVQVVAECALDALLGIGRR